MTDDKHQSPTTEALIERLRLHRTWRDSHGELNDAPNEAADALEALSRPSPIAEPQDSDAAERSQYNLCDGCGWVCENHPNLSWEPESDSPYSCGCGAGMPCPGCKSCSPPASAHPDFDNIVSAIAPHAYNGPSAKLAAEAVLAIVAKATAARLEAPIAEDVLVERALKLAEQFIDKGSALAAGEYTGSYKVLRKRFDEVRQEVLAALQAIHEKRG